MNANARGGRLRWRDWFITGLLAAIVVLALICGRVYGNLSSSAIEPKVAAWACAAGLVIAGAMLTRRLAIAFGRLSAASPVATASVSNSLRLVVQILGYVVVLVLAFWLLNVSVGHLLLGGALTGVILAVAAQQSLGNLFAGVVLLFARPFVVGDHIRIRAGALGGALDGVVRGVSLIYVTLETSDGLLKIPNAVVLAAAVGPWTPPPDSGS